MSLILDALSRSQRERGGDVEVPGIDTQHYQTPVPAQRNWRTAIPWIALGVALLVITFLLTREEGVSLPAERISSTVPVEQVPVVSTELAPTVVTKPQVSAVSSGEPQDAASEPPRVLPAAPVSSQRLDSPAQSLPEQVSSVITSPDNAAVAALYDTPSTPSTPSTPRDGAVGTVSTPTSVQTARASDAQAASAGAASETIEPVDIEALLVRAEQEVAQSRLSEHPAPFLEQLSQQKKDQIPTLMYSRHDYSSQASQSSVLINGKTVKVGATVAPGVKLDEILPDSSVFSFRGDPFRLVALNSWVNL